MRGSSNRPGEEVELEHKPEPAPAPLPPYKVIALAAVGLLLVAVRQVLIFRGLLYGNAMLRLSTLVLAGLLLGATVWILGSGNLTRVLGAVGLLTAVYAASELVVPNSMDAAAPGACPGAQTQSVRLLGTTHPNGANVRAGPARSFEQKSRFAANCSVGFVAYCIGDPEPDLFLISRADLFVPDSRWLILPRNRGFVHAGVVATQGVDEKLPERKCEGSRPSPDKPELAINGGLPSTVSGVAELSVTAPRAAIVGFASYGEPEGRPQLTRIALDADSSDGFTASWDTSKQVTSAGAGRGTAIVVAVVCLAGEVQTDLVAAQKLAIGSSLQPGQTGSDRGYNELPLEMQERLRRQACLLPDQQPAPSP